ncbi:MAG: hypothetical protein HRT45_15760 [Bdellovibrionales bacterium]|nr:hypothetical protein [Bdellovibrionales bacterium]
MASVVENYKRENRPVQRSLRKIYDSGFRESICLPLQFRKGFNQGFLYLNSKEEGQFKGILRDILKELDATQRLGLVLLRQQLPTLSQEFIDNFEKVSEYKFVARTLNLTLLKSVMEDLPDSPQLEFTLLEGANPEKPLPLASHGNLGAFLHQLYDQFYHSLAPKIEFLSEPENGHLNFRVQILNGDEAKIEKAVEKFSMKAAYFGVVLKHSGQHLLMHNLSEPSDDKDLHYTKPD